MFLALIGPGQLALRLCFSLPLALIKVRAEECLFKRSFLLLNFHNSFLSILRKVFIWYINLYFYSSTRVQLSTLQILVRNTTKSLVHLEFLQIVHHVVAFE